jgi:hypothetical protein
MIILGKVKVRKGVGRFFRKFVLLFLNADGADLRRWAVPCQFFKQPENWSYAGSTKKTSGRMIFRQNDLIDGTLH